MKNETALGKNKIQSFLNADIYRILSRGFSYPDENNINEIKAIAEELISIEDLDKDVSGRLERILSALEVKALQKEYSRLFLKGTVPICDSSYNRNADALSAVATFYKAFGLTPKTGESPDSLSYELEFLSILSLKRALARNQEESEIMDSAYSKFLNESLSSFVEKFAGRVEAAAPNRFYEAITEFLKIMMEKETE